MEIHQIELKVSKQVRRIKRCNKKEMKKIAQNKAYGI